MSTWSIWRPYRCLPRCTKAQLQEIGRVADELNLPAGSVLTRQGDVGSQLFVIVGERPVLPATISWWRP